MFEETPNKVNMEQVNDELKHICDEITDCKIIDSSQRNSEKSFTEKIRTDEITMTKEISETAKKLFESLSEIENTVSDYT